MKIARLLLCALLVALLGISAVAGAADIYVNQGEKTLVFDQDGVRLTLTDAFTASDNCNGIEGNYMINMGCIVENNTGKTIEVQYTAIINGWNIDSYHTMNGATSMPAGTKAKSTIWFTTEDCEVTCYEDLETMILNIFVRDENHKDLFNGSTGVIHFNAQAPGETSPAEEAPAEEAPAEASPVEEAPAGEAAVEAAAESAPEEPIIIYGTFDALEKGSKGADVKKLQQALIDQGFLDGKADGDYGNGTAGAVSRFQESVGLEATGAADEATQQRLFGGIDVRAALMAEPWFFNGGSELALNVLQFGKETATLTQITFDGNGRSVNAENEFPYSLTADGISIVLFDGSELNISFAANGSQLQLGGHEYWAMSEVDEALQGYWMCRYKDNVLGKTLSFEEHIFLGDGKIRTESANEGSNLGKGKYYYFGPYEGAYKLAMGEFDTDLFKGSSLFFNIINNEPAMMRYTRVYEATDKKFPGENGYRF